MTQAQLDRDRIARIRLMKLPRPDPATFDVEQDRRDEIAELSDASLMHRANADQGVE